MAKKINIPKPKKGAAIKDQQTFLAFRQERNPQFSKGERFYKKTPAKKSTGLLSGD